MPVFRSLHRGAKGDIICSFLKYFLASAMDTLQGPSVDEASRFLFSGSRLIRDKERNQEVHNLKKKKKKKKSIISARAVPWQLVM